MHIISQVGRLKDANNAATEMISLVKRNNCGDFSSRVHSIWMCFLTIVYQSVSTFLHSQARLWPSLARHATCSGATASRTSTTSSATS